MNLFLTLTKDLLVVPLLHKGLTTLILYGIVFTIDMVYYVPCERYGIVFTIDMVYYVPCERYGIVFTIDMVYYVPCVTKQGRLRVEQNNVWKFY